MYQVQKTSHSASDLARRGPENLVTFKLLYARNDTRSNREPRLDLNCQVIDNVRWFSPSLRSADRHGHQAPSRPRPSDEHADLAAQDCHGAAALVALPT